MIILRQHLGKLLSFLLILTLRLSCSVSEKEQSTDPTVIPVQKENTLEGTKYVLPLLTKSPVVTVTPTKKIEPTTEQIMNKNIWEVREGWFLANQIRALLFDATNDVLWAGGPDGLVRWDLTTENNITYVINQESPVSQVVDLAKTSDNSVWIGTYGYGITQVNIDGQWHTFTNKDGLPNNYISNLEITPENGLWVDTSTYTDNQGAVQKGQFGQFDKNHWIPGKGGGFYKVVASTSGEVWALALNPFMDYRGTLARFTGKEWEGVETLEEMSGITTFTIGPNGIVWVAAENGVFQFEGKSWKKIVPPWLGQTVARVSDIEATQGGDIWFGFSVATGLFGTSCGDRASETEEWGVYRYDGHTWTHYTKENGLVDNKICDITSSRDGRVWFGTFDKGISQFDGRIWKSLVIQ